eukprot:m51a1_g2360 hypothetical protein (390) ;mRNA; r:614259-616197
MGFVVTTQLTHKAVTTAEPVTGVVCISCTRPTAVVGPVEVSVRGEAMVHTTVTPSCDRICAAGIDWVERTTFYTMSPPAQCYDESRYVGAGSLTEFPPGRHLLPFRCALPEDLPVSIRSRTGLEHLVYYVRARVHFANGKRDAWSEEVPFVVVANNAAVTQERTIVQSDPNPDGVAVTCNVNSVAAIGSVVRARITVSNAGEGARDIAQARVTLIGRHEFENCVALKMPRDFDGDEEYFIDHVNGTTSWTDPRPPEGRRPAAASIRNATLDVTVLSGAGLLAKGGGAPDPYCCVVDWATSHARAIKTGAKKKTQNPVWTSVDGNTFRLRSGLETRNNVAVYVWDKNLLWDHYIGCANVDLSRIPPETQVLQWLSVTNPDVSSVMFEPSS